MTNTDTNQPTDATPQAGEVDWEYEQRTCNVCQKEFRCHVYRELDKCDDHINVPTIKEIQERHSAATAGPWYTGTDSCDCGGGYPCGHEDWVHEIVYLDEKPNPDWKHPEFHKTLNGKFRRPVAEDMCASIENGEFMAHAWVDIQFLLKKIESLTVQLATAQAWEEFNKETLQVASFATIMLNQIQDALNNGLKPELSISAIEQLASFNLFLSKPRPQPVDASSLARIARVARYADKYMAGDPIEFLDTAVGCLTPEAIAIIDVLAGGV
jgi:hypothetical protein